MAKGNGVAKPKETIQRYAAPVRPCAVEPCTALATGVHARCDYHRSDEYREAMQRKYGGRQSIAHRLTKGRRR